MENNHTFTHFFLIYSTVASLVIFPETILLKYNDNLSAYVFTFFIAMLCFPGLPPKLQKTTNNLIFSTATKI